LDIQQAVAKFVEYEGKIRFTQREKRMLGHCLFKNNGDARDSFPDTDQIKKYAYWLCSVELSFSQKASECATSLEKAYYSGLEKLKKYKPRP
jgi:CRISPR/Cas system CMR-associated protein Cmr3 (group 5 of RAMP superfamily)